MNILHSIVFAGPLGNGARLEQIGLNRLIAGPAVGDMLPPEGKKAKFVRLKKRDSQKEEVARDAEQKAEAALILLNPKPDRRFLLSWWACLNV